MTRIVLQTIDVSKEYVSWSGWFGFLRPRRILALDRVSLDLYAGEITGLVGENAAGKTTLLKIMAGLLSPTSGKVVVLGRDLAEAGAKVRQLVTIAIAESRSFYWRLTCRENLRFFAALWGYSGVERERRIAAVVEATGLTERLDDRFSTLSSGLMQRMALARALLSDARVWLFDEPARDLDKRSKGWLFDTMRRLKAEGCSLVVVSHEVEELAALCDRVVKLHEGRIST